MAIEQQLRDLPPLQPPVDAWQRIARRRRSERRRAQWHHGLLPALVALSLGFAIWSPEAVPPGPGAEEAQPAFQAARTAGMPAAGRSADLMRLHARSQALESLLRGLPSPPRGAAAGPSSGIAELEAHIALLDEQMNRGLPHPSLQPESLWQQRVDLMEGLVRARYIEAGAGAL
jgi:hypothetical protein